jgi:hypothetical protein
VAIRCGSFRHPDPDVLRIRDGNVVSGVLSTCAARLLIPTGAICFLRHPRAVCASVAAQLPRNISCRNARRRVHCPGHCCVESTKGPRCIVAVRNAGRRIVIRTRLKTRDIGPRLLLRIFVNDEIRK